MQIILIGITSSLSAKPPTTTYMSLKYGTSPATDPTKIASRKKIAKSIQSTGKHNKVIHYLGGRLPETPFEDLFPFFRTTFVRYEILDCETPNHYTQAEWVEDEFGVGLVEKQINHVGYFCNGDLFEHSPDFVNIFDDVKNYFWIDFCGMPKEVDIENLKKTFSLPDMDSVQEIYVTFFVNGRGQKYPSLFFTRYGSSLDDRARSLCDSLQEKLEFDNFTFSVFDVYVNRGAPMAVIKISRNNNK